MMLFLLGSVLWLQGSLTHSLLSFRRRRDGRYPAPHREFSSSVFSLDGSIDGLSTRYFTFNDLGAAMRDTWRCTTSPSGHKALSSFVNGTSKTIVLAVSIK